MQTTMTTNAPSDLIQKHYDYSPYDLTVFVDASGDDGMDFSKPCTSPLYAVGCFSCSPDQIAYNTDVIKNVKRLLGCRIEDEMKSSSLIRHHNRKKAIEMLSSLNGFLSMSIVFKRIMEMKGPFHDYQAVNDKSFTAFYHTLSMDLVMRNNNGGKALFVVDNMKKKEIQNALLFGEHLAKFDLSRVTTIFRDSRSEDFQLLQATDWLIGLYRKAIEEHIKEKGQIMSTMCIRCDIRRGLCKRRPQKMLSSRFTELRCLSSLYCLNAKKEPSFWSSIAANPYAHRKMFHFMDCIKNS